jgi:REP element-mobilizing transposase RayT
MTAMGRPLRMYQPNQMCFITCRTLQARFLLRPSRLTNAIVGGVLARGVRKFKVSLYAYTVTSNHIHLLLAALPQDLPAFMQFLLGNIARKVGRLVDWSGKFWERRYSAEPVLDDGAVVDRLRYVLAHGVKENLVERCDAWPGLTALTQLRTRSARTFQWFNWTKRWRGAAAILERWENDLAEEEELHLTLLPCWAGLSVDEQQSRIDALVQEIEATAKERRMATATDQKDAEEGGTLAPVLGEARILMQDPHRKPHNPKRVPRPLCHTLIASIRKAYRELYREFVGAFRVASARWRAGDRNVVFPAYAFPPPLPACTG